MFSFFYVITILIYFRTNDDKQPIKYTKRLSDSHKFSGSDSPDPNPVSDKNMLNNGKIHQFA